MQNETETHGLLKTPADLYAQQQSAERKKAIFNSLKFTGVLLVAGMSTGEYFKLFGIQPEELEKLDVIRDKPDKFFGSVILGSLTATFTNILVLSLMKCVEEYFKDRKFPANFDELDPQEQEKIKQYVNANVGGFALDMLKFVVTGTVLFSTYSSAKITLTDLLSEHGIGAQIGANLGLGVAMAAIFRGCAGLLNFIKSLPEALIPQVFALFTAAASSDHLADLMAKQFADHDPELAHVIKTIVPPLMGGLAALAVGAGFFFQSRANVKRVQEGEEPLSMARWLKKGVTDGLKRCWGNGHQSSGYKKPEEVSDERDSFVMLDPPEEPSKEEGTIPSMKE